MDDGLRLNERRSKISLRVHMSDRKYAASRLNLPYEPLTLTRGDPSILWLGPDRWLFVSDTSDAAVLVPEIERHLGGLVCSVTDMSAALCCYTLEYPDAAVLLGAGSGLDFEKLGVGQCARTNFAQIPMIVVPLGQDVWDLYVDVSCAFYVRRWMSRVISCKEATVTDGYADF